MKKILLVPFVLLAACTTPPPQIQVVEVTRIVAPPTERPIPTAAPAFVPSRDWSRTPSFDGECDYECETWMFYDGEMLMQVYSDGVTFGIFMVGTGSTAEEAGAMALAALSFGVPSDIVEATGILISNAEWGPRDGGSWVYGAEYDTELDLLLVSFVHDGPVNSRLG